jgi:hypothetical protein
MQQIQKTRRQFIALTAVGALSAALAGCGGGGGDATGSGGGSPTATTRSRVLGMHNTSLRGATQAGYQNESLAAGMNAYAYGAPDLATGGVASPIPLRPSLPLLGAFLRNVATVAPAGRAAHVRRSVGRSRGEDIVKGDGGDGSEPGEPGVIDPAPFPDDYDRSFYFDYYLGLWVAIASEPGRTTYSLFEDEAKTKPAGSIEMTEPADYETYPQVYRSSYSFTAGYLAGSSGSSENAKDADGSGRSSYSNVYSDGSRDSGRSNWSARGDFSWSSRTDGPGDAWTEGSGTFRADGSGGTRYAASDGYKSDYTYNRDGSGRGRIEGPDPGLPATITWDAYGNTTIRYADGTTETYPGWGIGYGGGYGEGGTTGGSDDSGGGSSGSGTVTSPPANK